MIFIPGITGAMYQQFAVTMALMARGLGIPARVVMGFYPGKDSPAGPASYQVHGSDVHAWVEIDFEGVGWVPFDAAPNVNTPRNSANNACHHERSSLASSMTLSFRVSGVSIPTA